MGYLLSGGTHTGGGGLKQLKEMREKAQKKWDESGFLEKLDDHVKDNIGILYENQASMLLNEIQSGKTESFESIKFPLIRQVFASTFVTGTTTDNQNGDK